MEGRMEGIWRALFPRTRPGFGASAAAWQPGPAASGSSAVEGLTEGAMHRPAPPPPGCTGVNFRKGRAVEGPEGGTDSSRATQRGLGLGWEGGHRAGPLRRGAAPAAHC